MCIYLTFISLFFVYRKLILQLFHNKVSEIVRAISCFFRFDNKTDQNTKFKRNTCQEWTYTGWIIYSDNCIQSSHQRKVRVRSHENGIINCGRY